MIALLKLGTLAIAALLVMGLGLGGGQVAADSLPGDPLYGLKLAAEQVRLALASDDGVRADLTLAATEARMRETTQILQQNRLVDDEIVARTRQQLEATLRAAVRLNDVEAAGSLQRLAESLRQHQRTMTAAVGEAPEAPVQQLLREMERVRLEAHAGAQDPEALRIRLRQGTPPTPPEDPDAGQPSGQQGTPVQEVQRVGPPQDAGSEDRPEPVRTGPQPVEPPGPEQKPQPNAEPQITHEVQDTRERTDPDMYPPYGTTETAGAGSTGNADGQGQTNQNSGGESGQAGGGTKGSDGTAGQGAQEDPGGDGESPDGGQGSQPDDAGTGQPADTGSGAGGEQTPDDDAGNGGGDDSADDTGRGQGDDEGNGGGDPSPDAGGDGGASKGGKGSDSGKGK